MPIDKIKMVRHMVEDENFTTPNRDNHILQSELHRVPEFCNSIIATLETQGKTQIQFISSQRIRATETADQIKYELNQQGICDVDFRIDGRIDALKHGQYNAANRISADSHIVKMANKRYVKETFELGNIFYQHGDPVTNNLGESKYPELLDKFTSYGECQIELSFRFYSFVQDLLNQYLEHPKKLFVLCTHSVIILRMLGISNLLKQLPNSFSVFLPNGNLYQLEFDEMDRILDGVKYSNFFEFHNFIFDIDIGLIQKYKYMIDTEIEILQARYMQHYKKPYAQS